MLLNLAENNELKITNTYFEKKFSLKWTWLSPDGETRNETDLLLINEIKTIKDVSIQKLSNFLRTIGW